jgi:Dihydroorotase and related cyclic amidohydrolases
MFDLVISGGTIVTASGTLVGDIAITGERIVALGRAGEFAGLSRGRTLQLEAHHIVLPGGVDPHIHCDDPIPDPETGGWLPTEGPAVVSRAALAGGITSLIDFVTTKPEESLSDSASRMDLQWAADSLCDYSFHLILRGDVPQHHLDAIPEMIEQGFTSIKVFTTNVRPSPFVEWKINHGSLVEILKTTAANGGLVAVHAEDDDIVMREYRIHLECGRSDGRYMSEVHNSLSEAQAIDRVVAAASMIKGSRVYIMHVSSSLGVDAIVRARRNGVDIHAETLHQFALRTDASYATEDGMLFHTFPSLKTADDNQALWKAVKSRHIEVFATDELCTSRSAKLSGKRIDDMVGGNSGLEPKLALLYTEIVKKRGLGLEVLADVTSRNASKIFGMYPKKGEIAVDSDADLAVLDSSQQAKITASALHETDYSPWEGVEVAAWPCLTVRRGTVAFESGTLTPDLTPGARLTRIPMAAS